MEEKEFFSIQLHPFRYNQGKVEYLVLKRSMELKYFPGMWQVITGTLGDGETALQTTIRELREEISHNPLKLWHIPYVGEFFDYRNDKIRKVPIFAAEISTEEIIISSEHTEFEWLDFESTLRRLELPSHVEATKYLKDYILDEKRNEWFRII